MASFDQAEGLRRLLESPKPRVLTFLSALKEEEKSGMLIFLFGMALALGIFSVACGTEMHRALGH